MQYDDKATHEWVALYATEEEPDEEFVHFLGEIIQRLGLPAPEGVGVNEGLEFDDDGSVDGEPGDREYRGDE